jgi:murein L,D-transpeptidase YafK
MQSKSLHFLFPIFLILALGGIVFAKFNLSKRFVAGYLLQSERKDQSPELASLIPKGTPIAVLIDKSDYTLQIFAADTLVKTYAVVFGGNPIDDKLRQGDQCTPEGIFKINSKYPHKSWSKFIWLNYPTADSWKKHKQAKIDGLIPSNAKIGGEIGIHGVPEGQDFAIDKRINWTLGCISLKNADVNEIYPFIDGKTEIKIQK